MCLETTPTKKCVYLRCKKSIFYKGLSDDSVTFIEYRKVPPMIKYGFLLLLMKDQGTYIYYCDII